MKIDKTVSEKDPLGLSLHLHNQFLKEGCHEVLGKNYRQPTKSKSRDLNRLIFENNA